MFKKFFYEFQKFAMRGNVIDMAVGIIIGAAFGKIVSSLVEDVIMPPLGLLLKNIDFSNFYILLKAPKEGPAVFESLKAAREAGAVTLNLGLFLNAVISFLIVVFAVFILIKALNKFQETISLQTKEKTAATSKTCPYCKSSIDIGATKCPHCTSELPAENTDLSEKKTIS